MYRRPAPAPSGLLYGFPLAHWTIRQDGMTPLIRRLYEDAYAVLTDPDGATAPELDVEGYRAITAPLSLPQVVSLVSELPPRTIARLTGRRPTDAGRQEAVRALYAPAED